MTRISTGLITPATLVAIFGLIGAISAPGSALALGPAPLFRAAHHGSPVAAERLILASCEVGCSEDASEDPGSETVNPGKPDVDPENPDATPEEPKERPEEPKERPKDPEKPPKADNPPTNGGVTTTPNPRPVIDPEPKPAASFALHDGPGRDLTLASLNAGSTATIAMLIADANRSCGPEWLRLYRIDCLRLHYQRVADQLPATGEYGPVKRALADAAAALDQIVAANVDTSAPQVRPRERGKAFAPRLSKLRAIKPEAEAAANAAAEKVVTQTAMLILRSGEDPKRRTAHYREIVAAMDSNLLLLRSA